MQKSYFGDFGGQFVPELLMPPLLELEEAMRTIVPSEPFQKELRALLADYVGRPSPLYRCPNLSQELGFDLWLKREDLNHTGAHKINNTMGQGLFDQAHGQAGAAGRDRGRPARRGHGHGRRHAGPWLHRLHGRGGRFPASPTTSSG